MSRVALGSLGLLLFLLQSAAPIAGAEEEGPEEGPSRFGEIIILRKEVFNPSVPGYDRFPFNWLNRFHMVTREQVLRRVLLFREGDPFDPELLEETERSLRGLAFINYASVVPGERHGDVQDIVVETHDIWSTELDLVLESEGRDGEEGEEIEVELEENNFLGYGREVDARYTRIDGEDGYGFSYRDPLFLNTRLIFSGFIDERGREESRGVELRRPYYSLETRWGGGVRSHYETDRDRVYREDREIAQYRREVRWDKLTVGHMFGSRYRKLLLRLDLVREENRFDALELTGDGDADSAVLPPNEKLPMVGMGIRLGRFRFVEEQKLDYFEQIEDVELGGYGGLWLGKIVGADPEWRLLTEGLFSTAAGHSRYASLLLRLRSDRYPGEWKRTYLLSSGQYYHRWSRNQTLAARLLWEETWKAEPGEEFFLDPRNGLRGYDTREDSGQRRLLLNVEDRIFSDLRFLTVAFGAALFADIGAAWDRGEPVRASDLRSSVGAGLRLGLTKVREAKAIRLDFSRNLRDGSFQVDFGLGHPFLLVRPFGSFLEDLEP